MSERSYCSNCGTENDIDSIFCIKCGSNMKINENLQLSQSLQESTTIKTTQPQKKPVLGIIGLIIGIITFFGLSWMSWITFFYPRLAFFIFAITGIVISGISMKDKDILGIIGFVLGILGILPIIMALIYQILFLTIWS